MAKNKEKKKADENSQNTASPITPADNTNTQNQSSNKKGNSGAGNQSSSDCK
jgi:hypothetical protein